MKHCLYILLLLSLNVSAQSGIRFEHGLTWADLQSKARIENKMIFVDYYMSWCDHCRFMNEQIFSKEEVGSFMNDKFISMKVQLDRTPNDTEETKSWYVFADSVMKTDNIKNYPALLFYNNNGNKIHREGGSNSVENFLAKVKKALNPETQYYAQLNKFKEGNRDTAFLLNLSYAAEAANDFDYVSQVSKEYYLASQKDLFTKENLEVIQNFTNNSRDTGFILMSKYPAKINAILGPHVAENKVLDIIMNEEVFPAIFNPNSPPDFNAINTSLLKKFPKPAAEQALTKGKMIFYGNRKDWANFKPAYLSYLKNYGTTIPPQELNEMSRTVFQTISDPQILEVATTWSKKNADKHKDLGSIISYASLLYKTGKKQEAITMIEKLLQGTKSADERNFLNQLIGKMKSGESTW